MALPFHLVERVLEQVVHQYDRRGPQYAFSSERLQTLCRLSRVCRSWMAVLLPLIPHYFDLGLYDSEDRIVRMIGWLRPGDYVRGVKLVVDRGKQNGRFMRLFPRFVKAELVQIEWDGFTTPMTSKGHDMVVDWVGALPALERLHVVHLGPLERSFLLSAHADRLRSLEADWQAVTSYEWERLAGMLRLTELKVWYIWFTGATWRSAIPRLGWVINIVELWLDGPIAYIAMLFTMTKWPGLVRLRLSLVAVKVPFSETDVWESFKFADLPISLVELAVHSSLPEAAVAPFRDPSETVLAFCLENLAKGGPGGAPISRLAFRLRDTTAAKLLAKLDAGQLASLRTVELLAPVGDVAGFSASLHERSIKVVLEQDQ